MMMRRLVPWALLLAAIGVPLLAAAFSPLLAWRDEIYIAAGFAGIAALALMLVQPVLIGGYLPGLPSQIGRRLHRLTGVLLIAAVAIHVAALWLTSPPDVIDTLLFVSPTPFSDWGVIAMWALFGAGLLAALRKRMRSKLRIWRRAHTALTFIAVAGSVVHALLIEGTMETVSKIVLCVLVFLATAKVIAELKVWASKAR